MAAEANVNVGAGPARALVISPVVEVAVGAWCESERQGRGIEGAEDYLRGRLAVVEVGEVDVPELAGFMAAVHEFAEQGLDPWEDALPIDGGAFVSIVRYGDGGQAVKCGLAGGGDGSRVVNVDTEITAGIDAGKDPGGRGRDLIDREPNAVGRRAVDAVAVGTACTDLKGPVCGDAVTAPRECLRGRDDRGPTEAPSDVLQRREPGGVDSVVVGQE